MSDYKENYQPTTIEADDAVDTSGGINNALSILPSEVQQNVRKTLLNPVQMGNPDGMTSMNSSDDSWKDALAGTLNDYGMGDAVDLYGNANVGPQLQAEPPIIEDPNAKLREQMMEREVTRSALRPLDGDAESGLVRATFMLNAASKHSEDEVTSAWQLSQKLDMPFDVTLDNLAAARLAGSEIVPDDIKSFAPAFLRLVQYDYDAAILWRHDLATANAVAEAFSPVDAMADTFVPMPNDDFDHDTLAAAIGRGVATGGLGIAQGVLTAGKFGIELPDTLGRGIAEGITSFVKPDSLSVDNPYTEPQKVSQWLGDLAQSATKAMGDVSEDAPYAGKKLWDNPGLLADPRWLLENGISAFMQSLPVIAAYVAGGGLAAGATGMAMEGANMYNELIAEGQPDSFRNRAYCAVYSVVAGALDATGAASMFGGIPAVKAIFKDMLTGAAEGGVKQAVKHTAAHVGMGFLGEGGTEWLQNIAQGGLESAAKGNTGEQIFNDVLASGKELENLVFGGLLGGAMAGVHSRAEVRRERFNADIAESVRRAASAPEMVAAREEIEAITRESEAAQSRMAFAQSLEKAAAAADSSTMHQADPVLFEQEAAKLIPEEARTVWLDVATVQEFTQGDPARLEALGLKQQDIEDAVTTGASGVQVPTMSIVARFQGEERQTLMQSARAEPGGMTQEEAQSFDPAARSEEAANRIRSVSQTSAEVSKEKTRLKQEFVQAGYPAHMAEYYATLHAAQARAFADRYGLDPVHELRQRSVVQGNPEDVAAGALHHPLNAGVNLNNQVRVVTVQPQFEGKRLWEMLKGKGRNALRDSITGVYTNKDTGWIIKVTGNGAEHAISSASKRGIGGMEHIEAVAKLPELIESAALVESHEDRKGQRLSAVHRMYAPMATGKDLYAVKLTVKESPEGMVAEIEDVRRLYDVSLEKKMPGDLRQPPDLAETSGKTGSNPGISKITLRRLLEGVKDHKGNRFLQGSRGAVSFGASGDSITSIFKDASDPSTPIHEGAHIFINDLIRVVADGGRMLEADFHQRISANNADAKAGTIDEKLRERRERAITQAYETRRRNIHWTARGDLEALVANANAQREAHGQAIGEDLVEVPLEAALNGSLTPEQMKTLQEVNATGFEAYVREGNAPSDVLRGVFHRMKEWLKAIYRALTVNGVKPTPEVARVFDRMLATDAAIDSSKVGAAMSNEAEFFEAINGLGDDASAEWSKKDRVNYKAALNKEGDEFQRLHELYTLAEAEVSARMDKEALKERNQRWKSYYAEGKEIAKDDVFYDVIAALTAKTDVPFSGISREWLERRYGKGAVADLRKTAQGRKIINSEVGMPLDAVGIADIVGNSDRAEAMGLSDADGLYNYLYDNIVVRQRSLARDAKTYADQRLADDDRLAEKTADVPGEAYRKYLNEVEASVLRMAARQGAAWRTPEQQARWVEQNRMPLATVRRQVREVLRGKSLREIMPNMYVGEVRAALQDRNAALLAGNARDALAAVDRARTALESWIEANRIIKEREAFEKQAARLAVVKRDVIAPEAYTAIQDLLERFQTVPKRASRDAPKPLQEVVDNLAAASGAVQSGPAVAEWLLTSDQEVNYKNLNVEQLQDVKDLLAMLERTGRDVLASNKASEAARVKEVADAGADSMSGLKPDILAAAGSALRGWQDWSRKFFSSFAAVQWQMRQADGFTNLGPKGKRGINEMRIYGAIVEGESRREIRMRTLTDRLAPVFQRLAESAKRMEKEKGKAFMGANGKTLEVPESMRQISRNNWTADNVIAMALNLGNEGNAARLREGFPDLKPEVLAQLLGDDAARLVFKEWAGKGNEGLLSAKDWRDVQEIWDTLHTQWADIRATHERMYGFKPRGVEAREITLSIGGKAITLPGGYYPAVYDPQLSKEVAGRNEKQDALARGEAIYAVPAARKGFTQGRANSGAGKPLMLSTGVVMSHLNDVTRFIELAETVRFADRVTQSPQWAQAYTAAFGKAQYDAIRPNLKNIVLEDRPPMDAYSIAAEKVRAHLIPWGLGWNFKTALLQSTALFPAMNDLGAANVMRGVAALGLGRYALIKEIWEISPYMKSRASNIDQDLRQAVKSIDERTRQKAVTLLGAEVTWDKVVEAGMLPLVTVDMATSAAIWLAAYNKEMGNLMDGPAGKRGIDPSSEYHKAAVLAADMAVKAVNPDFNPSSRSAFLRDRGVVRLLNMFSSAVVLFAQRRAYNYEALKQSWHRAGKDKAARLSAVGSYARYEAYDFLLPAVAMGLLQSLAGGSDDPNKWAKNVGSAYLDAFAMRLPVAGGVISGLITNETWRGMSTVFEQPVRMGQRVAGAIHSGDKEKMVGSMADALSFLTKIPVSRVVRSGMRGYDQWQRGEGTPLSLIMPSQGK